MNIYNEHKYDDIINLPHHKSATRKHMPISDRAAQFAPFAALTGYDDEVKETARLTDKRIELDEYEKENINNKLLLLQENLDDKPVVSITYFRHDDKKDGGKYIRVTNAIRKIKEYERIIVFEDNTEIPIDEILFIETPLTFNS